MGVDVARSCSTGAGDGRGVPARRRQPGPRARALARRRLAGGPRQDLHRAEPGRLRPLGRAAARGVDRQARQGPDPGARRAGRRPRPAGAGGARSATSTSSARSSSAGSSRPRSPARSSASTRSTSPTCRPPRTRPRRSSPPAMSRDVEPAGSAEELFAQANEGDYVCLQAFVNPTPKRRPSCRARGASEAGDRVRRHARVRAAVPALDRAAAQGRAADGALSAGGRRHRRRARRSPASRSGSAG